MKKFIDMTPKNGSKSDLLFRSLFASKKHQKKVKKWSKNGPKTGSGTPPKPGNSEQKK